MTPAQVAALRAAWPGRDGTTHWVGCELVHTACAVHVLCDALEAAQRENMRLAAYVAIVRDAQSKSADCHSWFLRAEGTLAQDAVKPFGSGRS